jgi:hypothetical protein
LEGESTRRYFLNLKKFDGAGEIQLFIEITNSYLLYMGK